jgi:arsenical pump membrane protein
MSNDATAVVLTPAILAAVRKTKADPLPYLFICAFIANAASFVLPISNPANLVVFQGDMPPLVQWFGMFLAASIVSIVVTYLVLRWFCRRDLKGEMENDPETVTLSSAGKLMLGGLAIVAIVLLVSSALGKNLGLSTCIASVCIAAGLSIRERMSPSKLLKGISWSVLPLVAGLFVLVEAVSNAGALRLCQNAFEVLQHWEPLRATMLASFAVGVGTNLMNNLPLGLIAGASVNAAQVTGPLRSAILIGVDLGPNLSITGSLATILWLIEIRKEGLHIGAWTFLKAGFYVMPPALLLATLAATLSGR